MLCGHYALQGMEQLSTCLAALAPASAASWLCCMADIFCLRCCSAAAAVCTLDCFSSFACVAGASEAD